MIRVQSFRPPGPGWLEVELGKDEMDHLWKCIKNPIGDHKDRLIGKVSKSLSIPDNGGWFLKNTLSHLVEGYVKEFGDISRRVPVSNRHPYYLNGFWVNYQNQYEYNPLHQHTGIFSFVIWMKVPYTYEDQMKLPWVRSNRASDVGSFRFEYSNMLGEMSGHTYNMSSEMEGKMLFFPSQLNHCVYPFYRCRKQRISISGNISLNTSKIIEDLVE